MTTTIESKIDRRTAVAVRTAVDEIITRHVFFAPTLLKHDVRVVDDVPTACVDGHSRIRLGSEFIKDKSPGNLVFLLAHECLHPMLGHPFRRKGRDPAKWNWAGDAFINETLIAEGIGEFIEGGVRYPNAQNMSVDELYDLAPDNPPGGGGGALGGDLDSAVDGMTDQEIADAIEKANAELANAAVTAKMCGKGSSLLQRMVDKALEVPTPWYDILAQCMTRQSDVDYDWTKGDVHFFDDDMFLPDIGGESAGEIVIVKDESGSVSDAEAAEFFGHLKKIASSCMPETIHVLHTSTRVAEVSTYTADTIPASLPCKTAGGTDMGAGLEYAAEHYPNAEAVIVLTDGETPWGSPIGKPIFWLITSPRITAPHGQTIHCELKK